MNLDPDMQIQILNLRIRQIYIPNFLGYLNPSRMHQTRTATKESSGN